MRRCGRVLLVVVDQDVPSRDMGMERESERTTKQAKDEKSKRYMERESTMPSTRRYQ